MRKGVHIGRKLLIAMDTHSASPTSTASPQSVLIPSVRMKAAHDVNLSPGVSSCLTLNEEDTQIQEQKFNNQMMNSPS